MSYLMASDSESSVGGFGCGAGCNCGPCRSGALSEWYEKEEPERQPPSPRSPATGPMNGWQGEQELGFYGHGGSTFFSPVVRFVGGRSWNPGCYRSMRTPVLGIKCHCRSGQIGLAGLAEPTTPLQKSLAEIKKALDLNPKGGYVRGTPARAALDAAFAAVPVCLAVKVFQELRFGTTPTARLFKYRLHPKTFQEMLDMLKTKVQMCLQALKLATLRNTPAPSCSDIDTLTNSICNDGRRLCKLAAELDEPDGWAKCASAIISCRDASQRSRNCS